MTCVENQTQNGTAVFMDDKYFINCNFVACILIYAGGDFGWRNSSFQDCKIHWEGPANRTINFLRVFGLLSPTFDKPSQPPLTSGSERIQ